MNENETVEKKKQTLQDIDIPKYIQIASVIFITLSILAAALNLVIDILTQGHATLNQLAYLEKVVSNVTLGLVFWGNRPSIREVIEKGLNYMNRLLKYLRLYFGISLILSILGCIIIVMSIPMSFDGYTAYPIFEQKPYFFVVLQFIAQMISSIKVIFGALIVSLIGFFIVLHFRRLYGMLRRMV